MYDSAVLTDAGRAFQARAVTTENAPLPSVIRHVVGTNSVDVDPELRRQRDSIRDCVSCTSLEAGLTFRC